ncbi:hypothetical protein H5410_017301 [Solanum commersonii]|uniref:Uncharacterized protein n=1 Tax=Solanum commersonii TaxID=4109 RepID=A0A9J5ZYS1_SOLCO|nr:hypothetical protein H5410_017301 [Solanum commersonii]
MHRQSCIAESSTGRKLKENWILSSFSVKGFLSPTKQKGIADFFPISLSLFIHIPLSCFIQNSNSTATSQYIFGVVKAAGAPVTRGIVTGQL